VTFTRRATLRTSFSWIVRQAERRVDETHSSCSTVASGRQPHHPSIPPLHWTGPCVAGVFGRQADQAQPWSPETPLTLGNGSISGPCVQARLNFLVSGGTGSGKPLWLNAPLGLHSARRTRHHDRGRCRVALAAAHWWSAETRPQRRGVGEVASAPVRNSLAHAARPHRSSRCRGPRCTGHAAGHEHRQRAACTTSTPTTARLPGPARGSWSSWQVRPAAVVIPPADHFRHPPHRPVSPCWASRTVSGVVMVALKAPHVMPDHFRFKQTH